MPFLRLGIEHARKEGKKLGRPSSVTDSTRAAIVELHKKGMSPNKISQTLRCGVGTAFHTLKSKGLWAASRHDGGLIRKHEKAVEYQMTYGRIGRTSPPTHAQLQQLTILVHPARVNSILSMVKAPDCPASADEA